MTPPTVQFIPAVAAGENWRVDALCGTPTTTRMTLTSITESGESANFDVYSFNPVRRADDNTYIEFLISIDTGGAYSSVSNFQSSTTNRQYSMSVDSVLLSHTSVTEVASSSTLLRVRLNCSAANGQSFWDDLDTSDDFVFTLTYD